MSFMGKAKAFGRSELEGAMVRYGIQITGSDENLAKVVEQGINFFEALLTHHRQKPPFTVSSLSEISPNKRQFFVSDKYWDDGVFWSCVPTKIPECRVCFRASCIDLDPARRAVSKPDRLHEYLANLMNERAAPSFHISQMKKRIPHKLKDIRTNSKYYGLCQYNTSEPIVCSNTKLAGRVFVITEHMNNILRLFKDEVYYAIDHFFVTMYDRWFAVRIPKVK